MMDTHLVLGLRMAGDKESLCLVRERSGNVKSLRSLVWEMTLDCDERCVRKIQLLA